MKPDFDKLIADYAGSKTVLIADVDCTAEGKDLCETHGVEGFPTIKWGDPSALEDFEGGRDYEAMAEFAKENLKPMCSPSNIDLCDADEKKQIADLQALSSDALDAQIAEKEQLQKDAEETFTKEVEALQARYEELSKEKEAAQKAVKDSGLALMKAVKGAKDAKDEL